MAFIGKSPPASYTQNPSQRYDISQSEDRGDGFWKLIPADLISKESQMPRDDRKHTRLAIAEPLILQVFDDDGKTVEAEHTVSENISLGGALVLTTLNLEVGNFLRVLNDAREIAILAVVRSSRTGDNGVTRLHLEFVDRHFPLEGVDYTSSRPG